jgi:YD repeat-containing protein
VENRLVTATGATTATLRYDPLGRLYEITGAGGAAGTTRFLYDGDALVAEYNTTGTLLRRYIHGPGTDDPLAGFEGAGVDTPSLRYFKANHQGSIVAVTNSASTLYSRNTFDDYGIPGAANATVADMSGSTDKSVIWFRHQPVPAFCAKRAIDMVKKGKSQNVMEWLMALEDGAYG